MTDSDKTIVNRAIKILVNSLAKGDVLNGSFTMENGKKYKLTLVESSEAKK